MNILNIKQQQIVEDNHNLIYSFANSKKIDLDEYYDLLAIGLCKAASVFDKNKGSFSTLAYKCMTNEYNKFLRSKTIQRNIPDHLILSLDEKITSVSETEFESDDSCATLYDFINKDIFPVPENSTLFLIMIDDFYNKKLTKQEQVVFKLLSQDKTQVEIGKIMSITRSRVSAIVKKIKQKWYNFNK